MDIGLVLGGGGARSLAHLGVLRALEEHSVTPLAVVACSTAAVIGALYASGHSAKQLYKLAKATDFSEFIDVDVSRGGLMSSTKVATLLKQHAPETFEALKLPLAVVAVDIQEGDLVVLHKGALRPAVCASNALPGVFEPVFHQGRHLIDGGVLNLVPTDVIRTLTNAPIIAVDVGKSSKRRLKLHKSSLWNRITPPYDREIPLSLDILLKAYAIREAKIKEAHFADYPPDLLIQPDLDDDFGDKDFGRLDDAVESGYRTAVAALEHLADTSVT